MEEKTADCKTIDTKCHYLNDFSEVNWDRFENVKTLKIDFCKFPPQNLENFNPVFKNVENLYLGFNEKKQICVFQKKFMHGFEKLRKLVLRCSAPNLTLPEEILKVLKSNCNLEQVVVFYKDWSETAEKVFCTCGWKKLGTDDCTIFYNPHEELQNTLADVAKKSATFCKSLYSKIRYHLPRMNCYKPTEEKEKEE